MLTYYLRNLPSKMFHDGFVKVFNSCFNNVMKIRPFSTTLGVFDERSYKLVIVGGGAGGITMASRLHRKLGKNSIMLIEPSDVHYYQPYWTLVGGGIKDFIKSHRSMASLIPEDVEWLQDKVIAFNPSEHNLETSSGLKIGYNFLILAMGLTLDFGQIKGLPEAFEIPGVCSNYSPLTVNKTTSAIASFKSGNAIFTQPVNPIKCGGAPQKIMYLAEDAFNKTGRRADANIMFFTALDVMFPAPKYDKELRKVAKKKGIAVHFEHNLTEVNPSKKEAIFSKLDDKSNVIIKYDMLHITPPMVAPEAIRRSSLCDSSGFLEVNKHTLQHVRYENIFGIGDCTNLPTSKTAAAVAAQCGILSDNITAVMEKRSLSSQYNGYTSCPLVTGNKRGILAEFDYSREATETLPWDQGRERISSYIMKKDVIPFIYWNMMLKGYWKGPSIIRKILHLGTK